MLFVKSDFKLFREVSVLYIFYESSHRKVFMLTMLLFI